jgi:F-type H+-transporting ATPase subunit b
VIDLLPNETVVFQWVIFAIAFLILNFGIFRPTLRILDERKNKTTGEKETAQKLNDKSKEMRALYEKRIEDARQEGIRKKDDLRTGGERFVEDLIKRTRAETDQDMESSRTEIERQSKEAALQLRQQARDLGRDIAGKILERNV